MSDEPAQRRGFAEVDTWVFDLDNTLYPHHLNLWHQVDARIRDFIVSYLKVAHEDAIRIQLRSDVPVGAFLSGGIDSTLVVSAIRELQPTTSLTTFCASFDDEELNEAPYARHIAERIGSDHHEVRFSSPELLEIFDALIDHYDEPFADASMFSTFAVCRAARRHCKVML